MKNRFNFEVTEILKKFLNIYLNPNMHKNPTKSFFIITGAQWNQVLSETTFESCHSFIEAIIQPHQTL